MAVRIITIEARHPGSAVHEYGAVITPKQRRFLRFTLEGGDVVFTKRAHIPARPFMRPGFDEKLAQTKRAIGEAWRREMLRIAT